MDWQPIESAPLNTPVLVFGMAVGEVGGSLGKTIAVASSDNRVYWECQPTDCYSVSMEATHWHPLPASPG